MSSTVNNISNNNNIMCSNQYDYQMQQHASGNYSNVQTKAIALEENPIAAPSILGVPSPAASPEPSATDDNMPVPSMTRDGRAPRPLNCFMTYRRDKHAQVMREQGHRCNNKFISKIIGDMWKLEPEEVKAAYKRKAAEGAKQHELAFPDYKYRPRSKQERLRQRRESEANRRVAQRSKHMHAHPYQQKPRSNAYMMSNSVASIPSVQSLLTYNTNDMPFYMNSMANDNAISLPHPMAANNAATNIASTFNVCNSVQNEQCYMDWPNVTHATSNAAPLPVLPSSSSFMETLFHDDITHLPLVDLSAATFSVPTPTPSLTSQSSSLAGTPVPMARTDLSAMYALPPACVQHDVTDIAFSTLPAATTVAQEQFTSFANWSPELQACGQLTPPMHPTNINNFNGVLPENQMFNADYLNNLSALAQNNNDDQYTSLLFNMVDTGVMNQV